MKIFTIGFTGKSAESFFTLIEQAGVKRVVDVRLNNVSQLAGFTKKRDLEYFCRRVAGVDYVHLPQLAPVKAILDAYRKHGRDWNTYEQQFLALMAERRIEETTSRELLDHGCLLCSEATPEQCHRRLVGEYLQSKWGGIELVHLI